MATLVGSWFGDVRWSICTPRNHPSHETILALKPMALGTHHFWNLHCDSAVKWGLNVSIFPNIWLVYIYG